MIPAAILRRRRDVAAHTNLADRDRTEEFRALAARDADPCRDRACPYCPPNLSAGSPLFPFRLKEHLPPTGCEFAQEGAPRRSFIIAAGNPRAGTPAGVGRVVSLPEGEAVEGPASLPTSGGVSPPRHSPLVALVRRARAQREAERREVLIERWAL